jgi:Zn2+/Cd2+-exporting ATPase
MFDTLFQKPPAWILSRRLSSFQKFFELESEESLSPFLDNRAKSISRNLAFKNALIAACFLLCSTVFLQFNYIEFAQLLLTFVYLLVGTTALIAAAQDVLLKKDINIDVLMTIAAFGALFLGNSFEGALLLVLFALAGSLEDIVTLKAKRALCALHERQPSVAYMLDADGVLTEKAIEDIQAGQIIIVRSGEIVPLDGVVVKGEASLDLSHMTGESSPVVCTLENEVPSGALVKEGFVELRVTCTSIDSTVAKLIGLISKAHATKPELSIAFERYGRIYALSVIIISFMLAFLLPVLKEIPLLGSGGGIFRAMSFLITASPCALILAIPITYLSALGSSARKGVIIKGWSILDHVRFCKDVAFDKTGTITTGELRLDRIISVSSEDHELASLALQVAGSLEKYAVHPLAQSIVQVFEEKKEPFLEISNLRVMPGIGIEGMLEGHKQIFIGGFQQGKEYLLVHHRERCAQIVQREKDYGKSVCLLTMEGKGFVFSFESLLRTSTKEVIEQLERMGKRVSMLTGDNEVSAQKIAKLVNISKVYAQLLPEDKLNLVESLSAQAGLMMVGDGINDAPALARSTVGVSLGRLASASAREASDIVLLTDNLALIPWLFEKAQATFCIVRQNIVIALCAILVGTICSIQGYIPLWVAVSIHEGSTIVVGLNALRLLVK